MASISESDLTVSEGDARTGYVWCLTDEQKESLATFRAELLTLAATEWPDGLTERERGFLDDDVTMLKFLRSRYDPTDRTQRTRYHALPR